MRLEKSELEFKKSDFWDYPEFLKKNPKSERFSQKVKDLRKKDKFWEDCSSFSSEIYKN